VYLRPDDWLATVEREYLRDFVAAGGAAVKLAVAPEPVAGGTRDRLERLAGEYGYCFAAVDSARTKIHMIDHLFHAVARQLDWDALARDYVRALLAANGYAVPTDPESFHYAHVAELNRYPESELRRDVREWLADRVYRDYAMAQEFRIAMLRLCQAQLDGGEVVQAEAAAIRHWLRGELRLISALKAALIFQKIARHNARDMLFSLAHWLRLVGRQGLVLTLDITRYTAGRRPPEPDGTLYHTTAAAMDAYEVLRQFIDGTDELEASFIAVTAPPEFLEDERRGLAKYDALRLRVWDEVRDRQRANPLSALVRLRDDAAELGSAWGTTAGVGDAAGEPSGPANGAGMPGGDRIMRGAPDDSERAGAANGGWAP
jgi:hypothetical protein